MDHNKKKVLISSTSHHPDQIKYLESEGAVVKIIPDRVNDLFFSEVRDSDALIVGLPPITRQVMEKAPRVVVVARHGVGYDSVDVPTATELGIVVTNTPGVNADAVAEFTYGAILAMVRQIPQGLAEMKKGGWRPPQYWGMDLRGKTLGIIGLGRIGSRVSKIGRAFGMKVLACDPYIGERDFQDAGAQPVSRDQVVSQADFLTLHTPLTEETRKMIGQQELARMKRTAYLVNTSRGGVVDDDALIEALDKGMITAAAIDVFEEEPPEDRRVVEHPKVLATPHLAGLTTEAMYRMFMGASEQVVLALKGQKPSNAVNEPKNPRYLRKSA